MILLWLIVIPLIGGLLAGIVAVWHSLAARWLALASLVLDLVLAISLWPSQSGWPASSDNQIWLTQWLWAWIPALGIRFHLALDGLSLLLVLLTLVLGIFAIGASWSEITERIGFFHFNVLWVLSGIIGVFLSFDLFLFYLFWELMLIPMYFLIAIWGHEKRWYASIKFFLFTQASGLLMLIAIIGLALIHYHQTGFLSFDYFDLLHTSIPPNLQHWLMFGFFIAFAVKLPVVPLHTWLPDAHTEAPTGGSIILAGLLLKTGAYGLLRLVLPLFPEASNWFAPVAMMLGATGILYGGILAFAQTDLKRLVAYTSVSHLGFVLFGTYAFNQLALQGVVLEILCHGLSTGGLFALVGVLDERMHTRDLKAMGGLWSIAPRLSSTGMILALASLGLPGLGNFIGEFLILIGAFPRQMVLTWIASLGLVVSLIYSLWLVQRTFHGPNDRHWQFADLSFRETAILGMMIIGLLWLGFFPQPVLATSSPVVEYLQTHLNLSME